MSRSSLALNNLRAFIILIVLAVHAFLAYLGSAVPAAFDKHPYSWRAIPIVDSQHWFGFDIFCAWQDIYLMALLFFLSGLFTWPSIARKGTAEFVRSRSLRLGIPYLFGVLVLMPLAIYPAYRVTAKNPGVAAYVHHLFALPFWDNGPMWFLWQLLVLTFIAAALYRFAPRWIEALGAFAANARPNRCFLWLAVAAVLAYVPVALAFTPMAWAERGPLSIQFSRPLLYLVFYLAGLGIGARGFDQGPLAPDGALSRRWLGWLAGASLSFMSWLGLMGLSVTTRSTPLKLEIAIDVAFAIGAASGCFAALAVSLRFLANHSRVLDRVAKNALGLYLVHYPIAVWLQFALLGFAAFAIAKAMIVLGLSLLFSFALVVSLRLVPLGACLVGEAPRRGRLLGRFDKPTEEAAATIPLAHTLH